jgi:hypothetical protein
MFRLSFRVFSSGLLLLLALSACMPTIAQPTSEEPSVEELKAQIATSVALTVAAYQEEQAALATPTPLPTETETPTSTPTLIFPTLTPFIPSPTQYVAGGGVVNTPAPYGCAVVNKSPADNTVIKPNKDFDVKFWLRNAGTKIWDKGADLLFDGGTNMLTPAVSYELPQVDPGEMVGPFIFDAKSPKKAGEYTMTFKVQGGFCFPYINIIVRK